VLPIAGAIQHGDIGIKLGIGTDRHLYCRIDLNTRTMNVCKKGRGSVNGWFSAGF
jgi:hypothetical protein